MKQILAIAVISLRSAFRSRVVLGLVLAILVTIIGLPLTIKGDGTVLGEVQVMLTYTLGVVSLLLSFVCLWAGCAAISHEVETRQIHLVVTKPVGRYQVWAGKWLALLVLTAGLLGLSGAVVAGTLAWKASHAGYTDREREELRTQILVAREAIDPVFPDVSEEAAELLDRQIEAGAVPAGVSREQGLRSMRRVILTRRYSAEPATRLDWEIPVGTVPPDRPIHLQYRFSTSTRTDRKIAGRWSFGAEGVTAFDREVESSPQGHHTLEVPPEAVDASGVLRVRYTNLNPLGLSVLFDPGDGLYALIYRGTFAANLVRALLVLFFHIALLSAIGVTAGALFSMPVASFAALFAMVLLHSIGYIESLAARPRLFGAGGAGGAAEEGGVVDAVFGLLFKAMEAVISPLDISNPLDRVGVGEWVPWELVGTVFLLKVVVYAGIIALAGGWLFNRRELGLPS